MVNLRFTCKQEADNQSKKCCTFDQRRSDNHRCTDVTTSFRLTSHTFHCLTTDTSNTNSSTNYR